MKAGLFQAELGVPLRHKQNIEYKPPKRTYTCKRKGTDSIDDEIIGIIKDNPGLIPTDVVDLQTSIKAKSAVYKRIQGLLAKGLIIKVRRGLYERNQYSESDN